MGTYVKDFNEVLCGFLIQLSPIIGSTYSSKVTNIIKYNAILPIEQFCCHALPVREKIINKDESYFINVDNPKEVSDKNTINEILKLKDVYINLDNESKSNIWEIFQALLLLSEEYVRHKYVNT